MNEPIAVIFGFFTIVPCGDGLYDLTDKIYKTFRYNMMFAYKKFNLNNTTQPIREEGHFDISFKKWEACETSPYIHQ